MKNEMIENFENSAVDNKKIADKEKVRSYRVGEETHAKMLEAKAASGVGSMEELFSLLLKNFELAGLREAMPEYAGDIDSFEYYLKSMLVGYLGTLNSLRNATALAREAVEEELTQKEKTISYLTAELVRRDCQIKELEEIKNGIWEELQRTKEECAELQRSQSSEAKLDAIQRQLAALFAANKRDEEGDVQGTAAKKAK